MVKMNATELVALLEHTLKVGTERAGIALAIEFIAKLDEELKRVTDENKELQATFRLRYEADMRAIALWQAKTGKTTQWPDHTDLVEFLFYLNDELSRKIEEMT